MPDATINETLTTAFGLLLGRPLSAFDPTGTYALYHWNDELSDGFFEDFTEDFTEQSPAPSAAADSGERELSPERWRLDHGRSLFIVEDWQHPVTARLAGGSVTGVELGRALAVDGTPPDELAEEYTVVLHRVVSDGSLFDALCAATWTMSAPRGLVRLPKKAEVEPVWAAAFDVLPDDALRAHLLTLCLTPHWARGDGAFFSGTDCGTDLQDLADLPGHEVLAAWQFGEGQAASAVLRVPPGR